MAVRVRDADSRRTRVGGRSGRSMGGALWLLVLCCVPAQCCGYSRVPLSSSPDQGDTLIDRSDRPMRVSPWSGRTGPAPHFNDFGGHVTHHVALTALLPTPTPTLVPVLGPVDKTSLTGGKPVFRSELDFLYSNVLFDPATPEHPYRVYYFAGDKSFPPTPGCPTNECGNGSATLMQVSKDGVHFVEPKLGKLAWRGSKENNVVLAGTTALGIYDDGWHERNVSRRFKAWGNLAGVGAQEPAAPPLKWHEPWKKPQVGGSAVSADGITWTDYRRLQDFNDTQRNAWRFDAQASMFYDPRLDEYVGTMRAFRPCISCGLCPIWWQPSTTGPATGCLAHLNSETCTASQCNRTVRAIGLSTSSSGDFQATTWTRNQEVQANHSNPFHQFYSQITFPYYDIYLGILMVFDAGDLPNVFGTGKVRCELSYSRDLKTWERILPGSSLIPHGRTGRSPRDPGNAWDSHMCYAGAHPVKMPEGDIRLYHSSEKYYMGADGPHYSWGSNKKNCSYGVASLRPDGFVGVQASGSGSTGRTVALNATGSQLVVTADTALEGASLTVSVVVSGKTKACQPLKGQNVTDHALSGCPLVVGEHVALSIEMHGGATLYTFGFARVSTL